MARATITAVAEAPAPEPHRNTLRQIQLEVRAIVRGAYDMQKLRVSTGNRVVASFKAKLGALSGHKDVETLDKDSIELLSLIRTVSTKLTTGVAEVMKNASENEDENEDVDEENSRSAMEKAEGKLADNILVLLSKHYKAMTENKKRFPLKKDFVGNLIISDYTELCLLSQYMELERTEIAQFNRLESVLECFPIWTEFLVHIPGMGPKMGGVIISEIDIQDRPAKNEKGDIMTGPDGKPLMKLLTPSMLWAYAGLDVAKDGRGRSRRKEHLVKRKFINKEGKEDEKDSITFNPFLKTKLVGVFGTNIIRTVGCPYRKYYDDKKHFYATHPIHGEQHDKKVTIVDGKEVKSKTSKGHRHAMAVRYAVKMFLCDLYNAWRKLEGLPIKTTYYEDKMGRKHNEGPEDVK